MVLMANVQVKKSMADFHFQHSFFSFSRRQ